MPEQNWTMRGEYMESCNCDYLCPCIYTNPQAGATHDHCTAVMAFRIDEGISGAIPLAGLKFALVIRSGKVMADGNWIFAGIVDAAADPAQRRALAAIVGGDAGGPPGLIRQNLVSDFRGVEFKPIDFAVGATGAGLRSPTSPPSRSRASCRATAAASLSTSTIPATRRTAVSPWRARMRPGSRVSVSTSPSRARATTAISRRFRGRPEHVPLSQTSRLPCPLRPRSGEGRVRWGTPSACPPPRKCSR